VTFSPSILTAPSAILRAASELLATSRSAFSAAGRRRPAPSSAATSSASRSVGSCRSLKRATKPAWARSAAPASWKRATISRAS
jgi:hypothetical protein